jgi:cell division protein FtsX
VIYFVTFYFYSTKEMNIKKMFTTLSAMVVAVTMTMPSVSVLAATPDTELGAAYEWAYSKGVTTMDSYEKANM